MHTRRAFIAMAVWALLAGAALLSWPGQGLAKVKLLDPVAHPKYVNPLPQPPVIDGTAGAYAVTPLDMRIAETVQWLGLYDPAGAPLPTTVWGYGPTLSSITYPGPTVVAMKDVPMDIRWNNDLPMVHLLPVDQSFIMDQQMLTVLQQGGIPVVTHLHGGHTEAASDGNPDQWYTQGWLDTGLSFAKEVSHYDNDQRSATLWYHDHTLGLTRLNVYAGLAGFYLLRDAEENALIAGGVLPGGPFELGMAIQDRSFYPDGSLFLPSKKSDPGGAAIPRTSLTPSIVPEFFGDFVLVNGMAWPFQEVEPRKYRLRVLNGSDSRFYILQFANSMSFLQIGSDQGLLEQPVVLTQLLLGPGERADLVVDFAGQTGDIELLNLGPDQPFKGLAANLPPANPATTGKVMLFRVNQPLSAVADASVDATTAFGAIAPLSASGVNVRKLGLFEGEDEYGRIAPLLGVVDPDPVTLVQGSLGFFDPITEMPGLNDVEVWEFYNTTADAHPIHMHLVQFQVIDREAFTGVLTPKPLVNFKKGFGWILTNVALGGAPVPPALNEMGFKDTVVVNPGEVARVIARFDRVGRYVWHCHILSHEEHDMMRPFEVLPLP